MFNVFRLDTFLSLFLLSIEFFLNPMALEIEMSEEEIQKDSSSAVKAHSFSGLEEVTVFINKVNEELNKIKQEQ